MAWVTNSVSSLASDNGYYKVHRGAKDHDDLGEESARIDFHDKINGVHCFLLRCLLFPPLCTRLCKRKTMVASMGVNQWLKDEKINKM